MSCALLKLQNDIDGRTDARPMHYAYRCSQRNNFRNQFTFMT